MIAKTGRTLPLFRGLFGLLAIASTAWAQGNTFNPYGNSGYADYREFGNPMVSNNPALPGQAMLNSQPSISRPRANSYQQYTSDLDGTETDSSTTRRGASTNLPYYQAYQRLNPQYNRVYRPNDTKADREFYDRQKKRDAAYSQALEERDPAKKAQLLRQVNQGSIDRSGTTSPRPKSANGSTALKPPVGGSARTLAPPIGGSARTSSAPPPIGGSSRAPSDRRSSAPSPFPSTTTRRPTTGGSTVRPPSTSRAPSPGLVNPKPAAAASEIIGTPAPR